MTTEESKKDHSNVFLCANPNYPNYFHSKKGNLNEIGERTYKLLLDKYLLGIDRDRYVFVLWVEDKEK